MNRNVLNRWCQAALFAGGLCGLAVSTGCQTTVGGQTLPSAYYLLDDVQYFPAGPEFVLTEEAAEHENYRLRQQQIQEGFDPNVVGP